MPAATAQDRCEAVKENYGGRQRCTQRAVGTFERTRRAYKDEAEYPGTKTVQLGRLCRRHAKAFNAETI